MGFVEEFRKLHLASPKPHSRSLVLNENCEYTYYVSKSKNLYYTFDFYRGEDCYYCDWGVGNKNCVDCSHIQTCELCYECLDCTQCYNGYFLWECQRVQDSIFCFNCQDSKYCFMSTGLRKKEYFFENQPCAKEQYFEKVKQALSTRSFETLRQDFLERARETTRISAHHFLAENVVGDFIYESKNCYSCFDLLYAQDCYYLYDSGLSKNSCDLTLSDGDLNYELIQCEKQPYNCNFCIDLIGGTDCEFCSYCFNCKNCFGCFSLQRKEFHILNKPYSQKDYWWKVYEIKEELKAKKLYSLDLFRV